MGVPKASANGVSFKTSDLLRVFRQKFFATLSCWITFIGLWSIWILAAPADTDQILQQLAGVLNTLAEGRVIVIQLLSVVFLLGATVLVAFWKPTQFAETIRRMAEEGYSFAASGAIVFFFAASALAIQWHYDSHLSSDTGRTIAIRYCAFALNLVVAIGMWKATQFDAQLSAYPEGKPGI